MVALSDEFEVSQERTLRFFPRRHTYRSDAAARSKLSGQRSLRRRNYDGCDQSESCSRDPIGYGDGDNLYYAYFVPDAIDPSGMIRSSVCQAKKFYEDCKACCSAVPGAGGRRGCENSCNRKPRRNPPPPSPPGQGPVHAVCTLMLVDLTVPDPTDVFVPKDVCEVVVVAVWIWSCTDAVDDAPPIEEDSPRRGCYDICTLKFSECLDTAHRNCAFCLDKCRRNCNEPTPSLDPWEDFVEGVDCRY